MDPKAQGETNAPTQGLERKREEDKGDGDQRVRGREAESLRYNCFLSLFTSIHNNLLVFPSVVLLWAHVFKKSCSQELSNKNTKPWRK